MRKLIVVLLLFVGIAWSDGWRFDKGRFPEGATTILKLSQEQKDFIKLYLRCRNNKYSPYIFQLSEQQREAVANNVGFCPARFAIFISYGEDADQGVHLAYNVVVRFSEDTFEVPHKLIVQDSFRLEYEEVMGWDQSPLLGAIPEHFTTGCPD